MYLLHTECENTLLLILLLQSEELFGWSSQLQRTGAGLRCRGGIWRLGVMVRLRSWVMLYGNESPLKDASTKMCVHVIYRLWIGEWAEPVIVFLPSCIPEAQVNWFAVHHHISWVVVKSVEERVEINQFVREILLHFNLLIKTKQSI